MNIFVIGCTLSILGGYLMLLARVPWWVPVLLVTAGALGLLMPML